jgi:hypothetical protein
MFAHFYLIYLEKHKTLDKRGREMYVACLLLLCDLASWFEMRPNAWAASCKVRPSFSPDTKQSQNVSTEFSETLSYQG